MSEETYKNPADHVADYLRSVLQNRTTDAEPIDGHPIRARGAGHIGPTFWADAPWRLEPDQTDIPFTLIVRDAHGPNVAMELNEIAIYEAPDDGLPWDDKDWHLVHTFSDGLGPITQRYWTYRTPPLTPQDPPPAIPLLRFTTASPGQRLCLKVRFAGTRLRPINRRRPFVNHKYLSVRLAEDHLPFRDSPQWYYGDTHYHSSYTNDFKEFGNPVPDTRAAAERIGLDWLVITDHSCDMVDHNPYWEQPLADSRWADLGLEVAANSDERFQLLRGQEVTVLGREGKGDDTLHMLVFGSTLDKFIPGAWAKQSLLTAVTMRLLGFARELFEHLFGPIYPLEAVLTGVDQGGHAVEPLIGRSVQAQDAVAFAAHPSSFAQAPGGTWDFPDLAQPINGVEAWNGGVRRQTKQEESPFDHWQEQGAWEDTKNQKAIDAWDAFLRYRVGQNDPRFILVAGSDAHGSFNYSEGWWVDSDGLRVDDNALGKVRTLLYLPHRDPNGAREAPSQDEIVQAVRKGSCIVTDGPVVTLAARYNGSHASLGEILHLVGDGTVELDIKTAPGGEFGQVERVDVRYYFRGMDSTDRVTVDVDAVDSTEIAGSLPPGPGYVRLEAVTRKDGDSYRCFTNPIWIKAATPGRRQLRATCLDW